MQRAMAAGQRIFEGLDVPITIRDNSAATTLPRNRNDIEFKKSGSVLPVIKLVSNTNNVGINMDKNITHITNMEKILIAELDKYNINYKINGDLRVPGILNITFNDID